MSGQGRSPSLFHTKLKLLWTKLRVYFQRFRVAAFSLRTLISLCGIIILLIVFTAAIVPVRYDVTVGTVPTHTITANRDVIDEVTTDALRAEAAKAVPPTYHFVEGVTEKVLSELDQIFQQLDTAVQYSENLEDYGPTRRYTAEELAYARTIVKDVDLRDYQLRTLLNTTREELSSLHTKLYAAVQNMLSSNVTEGMENEAVSGVMQIVGYQVDTSLLQNIVQPVLRTVMEPNMVVDQEATSAAQRAARDAVAPIVYKQGQNIIVKGEGLVEQYQYDMLSSLGMLSSNSVDTRIYLGAGILVALVLSLSMILLRLTEKAMVFEPKKLVLLFVILALTLVFCIIARFINIHFAPAVLTALLATAMLSLQAGIIFNCAIALLISALAVGGSTSYTAEMMQILICTMCSGELGAILLSRRSGRLQVIYAGLAAGACNFVVMMALSLMTSSAIHAVIENALYSLGGGLISGVLCIALQPLLEAIFNLSTQTKLLELSNPNHPLMRRLMLEAPGTYHHSLMVANIAEAAAEAVGANPLLARVGGYYHDVGKLRRPQYFKENQQDGENLLAENDPYTAAQIVMSHTHDGVTLARNYRLPREILRIIEEHHGNTPVMYFYSMAVKEANGQYVDPDAVRYNAQPPSTKEGAVVLLSDTIEAAVRSMKDPTPDAIEEFIIKLVRGKLQDGQLSNSPLTLKDLDAICNAATTVLNGVYHERIEYPDPPALTKSKQAIKPETKPELKPEPKPAPTVPDLNTPWDGITEEKPVEEVPAVQDEVHIEDERPETDLFPPPPPIEGEQIIVDPSQFESDEPLKTVELPVAETPLSIEEALALNDAEEQKADTDADEEKP